MHLIIFGAPGVGKGTQAKIIAEQLNIKHISTGDMLREAVKNETDMGVKAKKYMDNGELVPDDIMGGLVKETLSSPDCDNGYILDGYPRSLDQIKIFEDILTELNQKDILIIKLNAEEDILVSRLTSRRQCSNCCSIINLMLTGEITKCPVCDAENTLHKRKDDEESVIRHRLEIYHETTKPVIEYYAGKVPILFIEGTQQIEEVTNEILKAIKENS
jgi:adenylate kinase